MQCRRRIDAYGIVQGVGFRPAVFRLAGELGLTGTIANTAAGVAVEVQGAPDAVDEFVRRLPREAPALARIFDLRVSEADVRSDSGFCIAASREDTARAALVLPDVALCADCRRELLDPADRRFGYAFINCTNCGPRFTIVRDIPYDRPRTSMAGFSMCEACRAEYEDPADRRFHAQATCCPACGPRLVLSDFDNAPLDDDPVAGAVRLLREGRVVAIKGLGGFHLACDATCEEAVRTLRERKRRVEKPLAVMVRDVEAARRLCRVDAAPGAAALLASPEAPIVLLSRRPGCPVVFGVAPGRRELGIFVAYTPLHLMLFEAGGFEALVMTSGNLSEEPIAAGNEEARRRLRGLADALLAHDREILHRCDDSVVRIAAGRARVVRRSRGFVPVPLVPAHAPAAGEVLAPILAVGGELKNTLCLTRGRLAFPGPHVGDLQTLESCEFFRETVDHMTHLLGVEPRVVAHDMHPDYFSTRWAAEYAAERGGIALVAVQHHHAHIAACMAEHRLDAPVIGIALDGTGYGTDGTVWGGEVLLADLAGFERVFHLETVPMPGGEAAIRQPWRMALAWLWRCFGRELFDLEIPFVERLDRDRAATLLRMAERGVHAPLTSSCGRLFDAVAALCGLRAEVTYEAQAAVELEAMLGEARTPMPAPDGGAYPFTLEPHGRIGARAMVREVVADLRHGVPVSGIALRFHAGLVDALARAAARVRESTGTPRVCLGGGSFFNVYLLSQLTRRLEDDGFAVFAPAEVPAGDGGLALGQAAVAAHRAARGLIGPARAS